jgi:predicted LPLAT superfamily acyltransferase
MTSGDVITSVGESDGRWILGTVFTVLGGWFIVMLILWGVVEMSSKVERQEKQAAKDYLERLEQRVQQLEAKR